MKKVFVGFIIIFAIVGLFFLIMQLVVGVNIFNSNKNYSLNWYNNEFYNEKFKGKIIDFVRRDSAKYWLIYKADTTNQPDITGNNSYSFELTLNRKDNVIFNQTLINKIIVKDSATKKIKIFRDSTHFFEVDIPFSFFSQK